MQRISSSKKRKKKIKKILQLKFLKSAEENEESSTILETFENVEEDTNVEEESAGDEIEESHISLEITEDAGNKHGEEFANVEEDFSFPG